VTVVVERGSGGINRIIDSRVIYRCKKRQDLAGVKNLFVFAIAEISCGAVQLYIAEKEGKGLCRG